jgi:hypothetical protein
MHGVGGAATIAAGKNFPAGAQALDGCRRDILKSGLLGCKRLECAASILRYLRQNRFHTCILARLLIGCEGKMPSTAIRMHALCPILFGSKS